MNALMYLAGWWLLISLGIFLMLAMCYTSVMHFKLLKDSGELATLHWTTRATGYTILYIGLVLDLLLDWVVLPVIFLEPPTEWLSTERVKRHWHKQENFWKHTPMAIRPWLSTYRHNRAVFFAKNYLLPFDKKHMD